MARLIPDDKGTHYILLALLALVLLRPVGWQWAAGVCAAVAIGREVYGWHARGKTMTRDNWRESALDIVAGMAGCAVVLAAAFVGA